MTTNERIETGALPACLEGGIWFRYTRSNGFLLGGDAWCKFCLGLGDVAWVRYQGFERDYDAEDDARDWCKEGPGEGRPAPGFAPRKGE